ncbi:MAG: 3-oxoacid CoA-transferase [Alphaproteobacteria bacterium]|nr:3-oxoacid CoA-transferase [Alphaproteobacteria bacterium]
MHVITADEAARLIRDGDTILTGGSGSGHAVPDALMAAVERRFLAEGHPHGITSIHPVGLGDRGDRGAGHFAHKGLLKRIVCGTYMDSPKISKMALADEIEAYTMPQGVTSQLVREMAAGRPGLITRTGLETFVDPRRGGMRQSPSAKDDLVETIAIDGETWLRFKPFRIDATFLRGTTADEDGNVSMEQEAIYGEMLSMAQAAHNQGALVIVQVKRLAKRGALPAKSVKIPGMLVDFVVVEPTQTQTFFTEYSPAYAGELRIPLDDIPPLAFDERKVIARRAALELRHHAICNLGSGVSTGIAAVAAEENALDLIMLTNEQGLIGGAPSGGLEPGAASNYHAIVDQPYQFDFYDGGGLDIAFLSFVEIDESGNVNVSRFGGMVTGIGGFVNISQGARMTVFSGTFTAAGFEFAWPGGRMAIRKEGKHRKFVRRVGQLSYNGAYALERERKALFVTERAVFRLVPGGVELIEIGPGVDLERDVLAHMEFRPKIAADLREMDAAIFRPERYGLADRIRRNPQPPRSKRLAEWVAARR